MPSFPSVLRSFHDPQRPRVLPGFGLSLGFTVLYMSLLVLIPLTACFVGAAKLSLENWGKLLTDPAILAAAKLSFGASFLAALTNCIFGPIIAWVLVRYNLPMKRLLDASVDLPFALPTAVAGIALCTIYAPNGWIGQLLPFKVAYTQIGVFVAMVFISLPFVVRTLQPVLEDLEPEYEEAAATLGAGRLTTLWRVVIPQLAPALLTGFALAFARAVGEYGSIVFISGNMPMKTEILPLLIVNKLEQYNYAAANAIAALMLVVSFILLLIINLLQRRLARR